MKGRFGAPVIGVIFALAYTVLPVLAADTSSAVQKMLSIEYYSFGPVGFGTGHASKGERLYNTILRDPNALRDFEYLWQHGNGQARAYALTAFWKLDRARFERYATNFALKNVWIKTWHVDFGSGMTSGQAVAGIRKGIPSYSNRAF